MMRLIWFCLFATLAAPAPVPVIFDTDAGSDIDDAFALAFLLQSPELDVRAITTSRYAAAQRARLVCTILEAHGRDRVPVAAGGSEALLNVMPARAQPQLDFASADCAQPMSAVELILQTLRQSREKLIIVPVGPLTNIALALKTDPAIKQKIARIVLMGGAFTRLIAETNIVNDYAAAEIVFRSGVPITAVGLDVTLECVFDEPRLARLRAAGNPASSFLVKLLEAWQGGRPRHPVLHDPLAVMAAFEPGVVETEEGMVEVETAGAVTRGMARFSAKPGNVKVARKVNAARLLDLVAERVSLPPRR